MHVKAPHLKIELKKLQHLRLYTCSCRNFDTNREHRSGSDRPSKLSNSFATCDKARSA